MELGKFVKIGSIYTRNKGDWNKDCREYGQYAHDFIQTSTHI